MGILDDELDKEVERLIEQNKSLEERINQQEEMGKDWKMIIESLREVVAQRDTMIADLRAELEKAKPEVKSKADK